MPNLRVLACRLQTALAQKGRYIKINQFQSWSDLSQRMVTKFVVCEKRMVNDKCKDVAILETYQMAEVVKGLACLLNGPGGDA